MAGYRVSITYIIQPKSCFTCGQYNHLKENCPNGIFSLPVKLNRAHARSVRNGYTTKGNTSPPTELQNTTDLGHESRLQNDTDPISRQEITSDKETEEIARNTEKMKTV